MGKREKTIFIAFILLSLVAAAVILGGLKPLDERADAPRKSPGTPDRTAFTDEKALAADYEARMKPIFAASQSLLSAPQTDSELRAGLEEQMLDLTVPAEYRDLHAAVFLVLVREADGAGEPSDHDRALSRDKLAGLKKQFAWLN